MTTLVQVCEEVKRRITPDPQLKAAVQAKAEEIRAAVDRESREAGLRAEVRVDGSVAKDTWLRDYADVDIFMRVSPNLSKAQLRTVCLPIAKRALAGNEIVERFADHPYVESTVRLGRRGTLRVNIVPCYDVKPGQWLSATDRSPYHTEYIRKRLTLPQHDEVRLLKAFTRRIGTYGADIKTGGFSEAGFLPLVPLMLVGKGLVEDCGEPPVRAHRIESGRLRAVIRPVADCDPRGVLEFVGRRVTETDGEGFDRLVAELRH